MGYKDIVVINKVDLVDAQRCDKLEKEIKKIWKEYSIRNVFTGERIFSYLRLYRTSFGQLHAEVIRVKGMVRIANMKNPVIINYVFGLWDTGEEVSSYRISNFLVFIKIGGVQA